MDLQEKIATVPRLTRIDSSIDSCIKILKHELKKRYTETHDKDEDINRLLRLLDIFKEDFSIMKGKK